MLGLSMIPDLDQDHWQWRSAGWNTGFVYVVPEEIESGVAGKGVDLLEEAADFVKDSSRAQREIRQFLRSEGVKVSLKHISKDAAKAGKWLGRAAKVLAAISAYERYQKCMGN